MFFERFDGISALGCALVLALLVLLATLTGFAPQRATVVDPAPGPYLDLIDEYRCTTREKQLVMHPMLGPQEVEVEEPPHYEADDLAGVLWVTRVGKCREA